MATIKFLNKVKTKGEVNTVDLGIIRFSIKKSKGSSNYGLFIDDSDQAMTRKGSIEDCIDYLKTIVNHIR